MLEIGWDGLRGEWDWVFGVSRWMVWSQGWSISMGAVLQPGDGP